MLKSRFALLLAFTLACSFLGGHGEAGAQGTGGSFGGGDFGSGGGGGGSDWGGGGGGSDWGGGSSDWSSSGSSDWGGGTYGGGTTTYDGGSGGGGGGSCFGALCALAFIGGIFVFLVIASRRRGGGLTGHASRTMGFVPHNAMYVSQIQLGLDWRARAQLQAQLAELARTGDTRSPAGLARLLSETVLALRRAEMSWLYAGYRDAGASAPPQAQTTFQQLANEARSRFQHEIVRAHLGQTAEQRGPEMKAHAHEGQGTVVVTIVVAARRPMQGMSNPDAHLIRNALSDRGALTPQHMVALEVIWSPAAENDRMSTAELEQNYPELRLIDPNSIAGRVFCAYCSGPFPMELLTCPHCGAPAEASQGRREPPR